MLQSLGKRGFGKVSEFYRRRRRLLRGALFLYLVGAGIGFYFGLRI